MTDLHTHILFDIDDGSKDFEMSLKMLSAEKSDGVDTVVLSPHFDFKRQDFEQFSAAREERGSKLKKAFGEIKLLYAAEVRAYPFIGNIKGLDRLCIEGTKAILLEMPESGFSTWIDSMLYSVQSAGYTPVLVHIERFPYFLKIKNLRRLADCGILTQVNASSFYSGDFKTKRFIKKAVNEGLIHLIGSDCHSDVWRSPDIRKGYDAVKSLFGAGTARKIEENGDLLVSRGFIRQSK